MESFLTCYTYFCYMTQISLEAFLATITDTGHLGSSQDALSLSQSVNCGWSKQQLWVQLIILSFVHAPPTRRKKKASLQDLPDHTM